MFCGYVCLKVLVWFVCVCVMCVFVCVVVVSVMCCEYSGEWAFLFCYDPVTGLSKHQVLSYFIITR